MTSSRKQGCPRAFPIPRSWQRTALQGVQHDNAFWKHGLCRTTTRRHSKLTEGRTAL